MARTDPRPHYGSGRRITTDGYVERWAPRHPTAHADGYALEHRLVAYDAGLLVDLAMHVHHREAPKTNNAPSNLRVLTPAEHARLHHLHEEETYDRRRARIRADLGARCCEVCPTDISDRRIDATVCSDRCRVTRWKRAQRVASAS